MYSLKRAYYKFTDRNKFTLKEYEKFLVKISKYRVLPLNEFRNYHNDNEVVIGLRYDIDDKWKRAVRMAERGYKYNIRSTAFVLHSAKYFNDKYLIQELLWMQSQGTEIGVHNNCFGIKLPPQAVIMGSEMWRKVLLKNTLYQLRKAGLNIVGTSAHGDKEHKNISFWKYFDKTDFGIFYEAYELDHNKYFSDCTFIDGHRWNPNDLPELKLGDRVQILIHPQWYR